MDFLHFIFIEIILSISIRLHFYHTMIPHANLINYQCYFLHLNFDLKYFAKNNIVDAIKLNIRCGKTK